MDFPDFVIIDASHWLHKAYHAFPPLSRADGHPTGAITGVLQTLVWQLTKGALSRATHALAVFDGPGRNFRHSLDAGYKAQRTRHDDLYVQTVGIKAAIEACGMATIAVAGVEADDVIAAHVEEARMYGAQTVILSNDKDLTQLIRPTVRMMESMGSKRGQITDVDALFERWGVAPEQMASLLALMGDAADNVAGVPGIGAKMAAKLLTNFRDLDDLFERLSEVQPDRIRQLLTIHYQAAREAHRLIKLPSPDCPELPVMPMEALLFSAKKVDEAELLAFCDAYEMVAAKEEIRLAFSRGPAVASLDFA
jgi:DNA polymerase-1